MPNTDTATAKLIGYGQHPTTGKPLHETWQRDDGTRFTLLFDPQGSGKLVRAYEEDGE